MIKTRELGVIFILIGMTLVALLVGIVVFTETTITKEKVPCYDYNNNLIEGLTCIKEEEHMANEDLLISLFALFIVFMVLGYILMSIDD